MLRTTVLTAIRCPQRLRLSSISLPISSLRTTRNTQWRPQSSLLARPFSIFHQRRVEQPPSETSSSKPAIRENIYTIPNLLTVSRIISCPVLAWSILDGNYYLATGLLVYAGLTDLVRLLCFVPSVNWRPEAGGRLPCSSIQYVVCARNYTGSSGRQNTYDNPHHHVDNAGPYSRHVLVLYTPTINFNAFLVPLAVIILGRDVLLILSALYIRYSTLPHPVCHFYICPGSFLILWHTENVFALLGLLVTIGRSASDEYQQIQYCSATAPYGDYDCQPDPSIQHHPWTFWIAVRVNLLVQSFSLTILLVDG